MSVFGRGRGEALVVHLGAGRWMTVDSFNDPETGGPVVLRYLEELGVHPSAIELCCVTHWDQDHINGITTLVRAATNAKVVLSLALRRPDFVRLALEHQKRTYANPLGSGTREFVKLLELLKNDGRALQVAVQDTVLHDADGTTVVALAPSSGTALEALGAASVAALEAAQTGDSVVEPTPNDASLVLRVASARTEILLGGDLERDGWRAVIESVSLQGVAAQHLKVPHHGSKDADNPRLWAEKVTDNVEYAVTRFNNGEHSLPREADRERLRARSRAGVVIGPASTRRHLHGLVGRRVRAATKDGVWRVTGVVGHARWRSPASDSSSAVAVFGATEPI